MPVPDRVLDDVSGIQGRFLRIDWIPAFTGMTGICRENSPTSEIISSDKRLI